MRRRNSLRTDFLFNLTFLCAAALLLALGSARVLEHLGIGGVALLPIVLTAVVLVLLMGNHLLQRSLLRPLAEIMRSAESIAAGEYTVRVPDGGPVEIVALAGALNQLTDQLLQNQARLAENVRSLDRTNQELTRAQRELVHAAKLASLGQLSAGVAHEIGNPLTALFGYVGLLRRGDCDGEIVEGLDRESRRIDRIVRGLLEYSRPGMAIREPVSVNAAIEGALALLRGQGSLTDIEVELELTSRMPPVLGDPHRMEQLFLNLLQNAERAMGGRGAVRISTRVERYIPDAPIAVRRADDPPGVNYAHLRRARGGAPNFEGRLDADQEIIRVEVADFGPGIPEEILGSIFDPFFTTREPGEGTGLGLAIVAGMVADLGGRISASTPAGGGALFTLWLPTSEEVNR